MMSWALGEIMGKLTYTSGDCCWLWLRLLTRTPTHDFIMRLKLPYYLVAEFYISIVREKREKNGERERERWRPHCLSLPSFGSYAASPLQQSFLVQAGAKLFPGSWGGQRLYLLAGRWQGSARAHSIGNIAEALLGEHSLSYVLMLGSLTYL